jgi:hypothetical protein
MSRDIVDTLSHARAATRSALRERLVDAARVERELAEQLPVQVDHSNVLIGDQELDRAALVGPAEPDL